MKRTSLPTIAGVINIIIGSIYLLGGIGIGVAFALGEGYGTSEVFPIVLLIIIAMPLAFSLPSIVGGIYAMQRKNWVIVLIGSITSLIIGAWVIIGLIPLILVILSKEEFEQTKKELA